MAGILIRKPEILLFLAELIPKLKEVGVTHIGVEVPSDQQRRIDYFMKTGEGLNNVRFHRQFDYPDYRYLFHVILTNGLKPVAIDLPYSKFGGDIKRVEWMARSLLAVFKKKPADYVKSGAQ